MKRGNSTVPKMQLKHCNSKFSRKDELKPSFNLDHLVKERYPRFIDALRDMDDALCMIHLFAAMPSEGRITVSHTSTCKTLVRQWQYYIAKARNLHKVFVSVKGIYYQTVIMGEEITWLAPHQFTQNIPKEVDLRVMITFLEFYEVFMRFVLFKLYGTLNLKYPPEINPILDDAGCFLYAVRAKSVDGNDEEEIHFNRKFLKEAEENKAIGQEQDGEGLDETQRVSLELKLQEIQAKEESEQESMVVPLTSAFTDLGEEQDEGEERRIFAEATDDRRGRLFAKLKFFINREVPLEWLQFCIVSFGGLVGWDGPASPFTSEDPSITHQVVDRPMLGTGAHREYVQPQWVFDSINAVMLLPVSNYRPGCPLPPHLSPFVDDEKEGYVPKYREDLIKLAAKGGVKAAVSTSADDDATDDVEESDADSEHQRSSKRVEELEEDEDNDDIPKKGPRGVVYEPSQPKQSEVS